MKLAVSHFHDVVVSKEGHAEGQDILLDIKYQGQKLNFNKEELLKACSISMPVDQKRNMMNASSNFNIIESILTALRTETNVKVHTPGVDGEIVGYPVVIDGTTSTASFDESVWSMEEMRNANRRSIYCDGVADIKDGCLHYTPELVAKVKEKFNVDLPQVVAWDDIESVGQFIIDNIINSIMQ